jgi:hypothetical protein
LPRPKLGKRRLPLAVAAQKRDPVVLVDAQVQPLQDGAAIADAAPLSIATIGGDSSSGWGKVKTRSAASSGGV